MLEVPQIQCREKVVDACVAMQRQLPRISGSGATVEARKTCLAWQKKVSEAPRYMARQSSRTFCPNPCEVAHVGRGHHLRHRQRRYASHSSSRKGSTRCSQFGPYHTTLEWSVCHHQVSPTLTCVMEGNGDFLVRERGGWGSLDGHFTLFKLIKQTLRICQRAWR